MKNKYLKFCDHIAKACGAFAVLALLLSILVIVELVFERYFFQRAITWQTELVTMLLVASTFIDCVTYRLGLQCILTITPMCYCFICVSLCIVSVIFRYVLYSVFRI